MRRRVSYLQLVTGAISRRSPASAAPRADSHRTRVRGVYLAPAPAGALRLQAIDSHGDALLELTIARRAFDPAMGEWARALLDVHDPPATPRRTL